MLEKEFRYFIANQGNLVEKHNGKHIVIIQKEVVQAFESLDEAYLWVVTSGYLGRALIQHVFPGTDCYTQRFYSGIFSGM